MTEEETQLLILKGLLSELDPESQEKISRYRAEFQKILDEDMDNGMFAMSLVALENKTSPKK
jgi:hypothetical protein